MANENSEYKMSAPTRGSSSYGGATGHPATRAGHEEEVAAEFTIEGWNDFRRNSPAVRALKRAAHALGIEYVAE